MTDEVYLSEEKYKELEAELEELKTSTRKELAEGLEAAIALGDLKENAEYHELKARKARLEGRILEIQDKLRRAKILKEGEGGAHTVTMGSKLTVESGGKDEDISIVGVDEADFLAGKISSQSPLGSALLGKRTGDKVKVELPKGAKEYTIKKIS